MDGWEFAIYKYSDNGYDPEEWGFPGAELLDGTVTGAMEAGMEAYPEEGTVTHRSLSNHQTCRSACFDGIATRIMRGLKP